MKRAVFLLLCLLGIVWAPFAGPVSVSPSVLWNPKLFETSAYEIFWNIRLPRLALGMLAGAGLSAGGLIFQAMFRNPLACPYTLGVSTGAAFGAVLAIWLGAAVGANFVGMWAFVGALATIAVVASFGRRQSSAGMLLAGVAVSIFLSSLIVLLQYLSDFNGLFRIVRWLMGGIEAVGWSGIWQVLLPVALGLMLIWYFAGDLDVLLHGDEFAHSRGVNVQRARWVMFLSVSLMVGAIVSTCGPIAFVGIMVPHVCRLMFGGRHRQLLLYSVFVGAAFLAVCDSIGRLIIPPFEIPVGVMTALVGGPFFLWLLLGVSKVDLGDKW